MDSFSGKLAVVTGDGSGMGRELVRQLAAQGCSVGTCDVNADAVAETATLARAGALPGILVTSHACDVSDEAQVLRFRDEVLAEPGGSWSARTPRASTGSSAPSRKPPTTMPCWPAWRRTPPAGRTSAPIAGLAGKPGCGGLRPGA